MIKSRLPKGEEIKYEQQLVALRTKRQHEAASLRAMRATKTLRRGGSGYYGSPDCWNTYTKLTVVPVGRCDKVGCEQPATERIAINCHGCVYECDVCEKHAGSHGKWVDSL